MPTFDSLLALIGQPEDSDAVRAAIASDSLVPPDGPDPISDIMGRSSLIGHEAGYELMIEEGRIDTVFVYPIATGEFRPFVGPLAAGLSAESTREDVRERLGLPSREGGPMGVPGLGLLGPWDRYDSDRTCLHFRYAATGGLIVQVTIMDAETAP